MRKEKGGGDFSSNIASPTNFIDRAYTPTLTPLRRNRKYHSDSSVDKSSRAFAAFVFSFDSLNTFSRFSLNSR